MQFGNVHFMVCVVSQVEQPNSTLDRDGGK